ncbi:hypothetical protein L208DRAFT_1460588 [Tricholoma matsutake]|nr:hypothetical protein L208DRAFT_1460588 [Tricholoma matsutake 945]
MANLYYSQNGGYNPCNPQELYLQYPPPIQNPAPAPQPPPHMPQRPAQFPPAKQPTQPQAAQRKPTSRARGEVNTLPLRQLLLNEQVMVNLEARGWVLGIVLATVELVNAIAGWGYRVRFIPPGKNSEEVDTFPHHSDSIRLP